MLFPRKEHFFLAVQHRRTLHALPHRPYAQHRGTNLHQGVQPQQNVAHRLSSSEGRRGQNRSALLKVIIIDSEKLAHFPPQGKRKTRAPFKGRAESSHSLSLLSPERYENPTLLGTHPLLGFQRPLKYGASLRLVEPRFQKRQRAEPRMARPPRNYQRSRCNIGKQKPSGTWEEPQRRKARGRPPSRSRRQGARRRSAIRRACGRRHRQTSGGWLGP